jgi:hypothetical protein
MISKEFFGNGAKFLPYNYLYGQSGSQVNRELKG